MAKRTVRTADGRLIEVDDSGAPKTEGITPTTPALPGAPAPATPPVTPRGVAAAGGSPDQAKMAGTPAQKAPVLQEQVATAAQEAYNTRLTPTPTAPPASATVDQASATRLQASLGGLGAKVKGLADAYMQAAAAKATGPQISDAALKQLMPNATPAQLAAAKVVLQGFLPQYQAGAPAAATSGRMATLATEPGAPAPKSREALTAELATSLGVKPEQLAGGALAGLFGGADLTAAVSGALGSTAREDLTLGELDAQQPGSLVNQQMADDLGVSLAALGRMTPAEVQGAAQSLLARQFSDIERLRRELPGASPARAAQIRRELETRQLEGEAEASAAQTLGDELARGFTVKFRGEDIELSKLLKSERVSDLVREALVSPSAMAELKAASPQLAEWAERQRGELTTLYGDLAADVRAVQTTQTETSKLLAGLPDALLAKIPGYKAGQTLTPQQAADIKAAVAKMPLAQAWNNPKLGPALKAALAADPKALDYLSTLSVKDIETRVSLAEQIRTDPKLLALVGETGPVFTGDAVKAHQLISGRATLARTVPALAAKLTASPDLVAFWSQPENVKALSADPTLQGLVKNNTIKTADDAKRYLANPLIRTNLDKIQAESTQLNRLLDIRNAPDFPQKAMDTLYGHGFTPAHAQHLYDEVRAAELSAEERGYKLPADVAQKKTLLLRMFDQDGDGRVSSADFTPAAIAARLSKMLAAGSTPDKVLNTAPAFVNTPMKDHLAAEATLSRLYGKDSLWGVKQAVTDSMGKQAATTAAHTQAQAAGKAQNTADQVAQALAPLATLKAGGKAVTQAQVDQAGLTLMTQAAQRGLDPQAVLLAWAEALAKAGIGPSGAAAPAQVGSKAAAASGSQSWEGALSDKARKAEDAFMDQVDSAVGIEQNRSGIKKSRELIDKVGALSKFRLRKPKNA